MTSAQDLEYIIMSNGSYKGLETREVRVYARVCASTNLYLYSVYIISVTEQ